LVAPIEFTLKLADYAGLGGYIDQVRSITSVAADDGRKHVAARAENPWPIVPSRTGKP
jgi:hypothetical protein